MRLAALFILAFCGQCLLCASPTSSPLGQVAGLKIVSNASIYVSPKYQNSPFYKHLSTAASRDVNIEAYYFPSDIVAVITTKDGSNVVRVKGTTATEHWTYGRNRSLPSEYLSKQPGKMLMSILPYWPQYHVSLMNSIPGSQHRLAHNSYQVKLPFRISGSNPVSYYYIMDCTFTKSIVDKINMYFFEIDRDLKWTFGTDLGDTGVWLEDYKSAAPLGAQLPLDLAYTYDRYDDGLPRSVKSQQYLRQESEPIITVNSNITSVSKFDPVITPDSLVDILSAGHNRPLYSDLGSERSATSRLMIFAMAVLIVLFSLFAYWRIHKKA